MTVLETHMSINAVIHIIPKILAPSSFTPGNRDYSMPQRGTILAASQRQIEEVLPPGTRSADLRKLSYVLDGKTTRRKVFNATEHAMIYIDPINGDKTSRFPELVEPEVSPWDPRYQAHRRLPPAFTTYERELLRNQPADASIIIVLEKNGTNITAPSEAAGGGYSGRPYSPDGIHRAYAAGDPTALDTSPVLRSNLSR